MSAESRSIGPSWAKGPMIWNLWLKRCQCNLWGTNSLPWALVVNCLRWSTISDIRIFWNLTKVPMKRIFVSIGDFRKWPPALWTAWFQCQVLFLVRWGNMPKYGPFSIQKWTLNAGKVGGSDLGKYGERRTSALQLSCRGMRQLCSLLSRSCKTLEMT